MNPSTNSRIVVLDREERLAPARSCLVGIGCGVLLWLGVLLLWLVW